MREYERDSRPSDWHSNALNTRPQELLEPWQNLSGIVYAFKLLLW